jgi:hypothetical protein
LTWYDYQTRFGIVGKLIDRLIFRRLLGWATAWSFDCLRLWIELGIDPTISMRNSLIHALARICIATIWLYQGLIPKILLLQADELKLMTAAGVSAAMAPTAIYIVGIAEIAIAVLTLLLWRKRWSFLFTVALMTVAFLSVVFTVPAYLGAVFNPFSLNLAMTILAVIGYISAVDIPSAARCLREPKEK